MKVNFKYLALIINQLISIKFKKLILIMLLKSNNGDHLQIMLTHLPQISKLLFKIRDNKCY